ncbi:MAG TPA: ATP-binding cassette domain-containing protein [Chthonomonadaceae bacterium]|nr:ATP-binding cassette domain-containing protein [Chthonomonadaceae bacterium]
MIAQDGALLWTEEQAPAWFTCPGKEVTLYAPQDSYAAQHVQVELRKAERVIEALKRLLTPAEESAAGPIRVYLMDAVHVMPSPDSMEPEAGAEAIVCVMQPDAPGTPLALPLTRLLIRRWFGENAAQATVIVDGLAGVIAARTKTGPSLYEVEQWVHAEMEEGPISLIAQNRRRPVWEGGAAAEGGTQAPDDLDSLATSFVAFLLSSFGPAKLRKFLARYDPVRRDMAARAVYHRPLAVLEEAWLAGLRRRAGGEGALRSLLPALLQELKPYRWRQAEILVYLLWVAAFKFVEPAALQVFVNFLQHKSDKSEIKLLGYHVPIQSIGSSHFLLYFLVTLAVLYLLNGGVTLRRAHAVNWLNLHVLNNLQERMFAHLQRLSHSYYGEAKIGDLVARNSDDIKNIKQVLSQFTDKGLVQIFTLLGAVFALFSIGWGKWWLIGLVLAVLPLFAISFVALRTRNKQASREQSKRTAETLNLLQENLSAHAVIKAFCLEKMSIAAYRARLKAQRKAAMRLARLSALLDLNEDTATALAQLIIFGVGAKTDIGIASLVALMPIIKSLFGPIASLSGMGQTIQQASGAMERVTELLHEPVAIAEKPDAKPLPPLSRDIRLENITFSYNGRRTILRDLNLTIPAGSHVAFVGPSGCGKTTILSLIMRFWDPDQGRVLLDGHDLRDGTLASLRSQIGYVFQDTFIFDTTVRENIALGRLDATDAEIAAAARAARLESFINSLPAGYDTVVTGARMSGGQRQRIGIARAILRAPRLLILDEATSALDAKTEAEIQETLMEVAKGQTTISVTHRLSWAAGADWIFVLDNGQVVEQGRHADLLALGGLYRKLYEEQNSHAGSAGQPIPRPHASYLRAVPLFRNLTEEALDMVAQKLKLEWHAAGADIVRQGDPSDKLYLILQGQVDILLRDRQGGRRINTLAEGDFFGEMGLLGDAPRSATVRAAKPTLLYSLSKEDFSALLQREPPIRQIFSETVAARQVALATAVSRAEG